MFFCLHKLVYAAIGGDRLGNKLKAMFSAIYWRLHLLVRKMPFEADNYKTLISCSAGYYPKDMPLLEYEP